MTGAIWSTPADKAALDFPATTLVRFFHNHHLLQLEGKPKWLTVQGGSSVLTLWSWKTIRTNQAGRSTSMRC